MVVTHLGHLLLLGPRLLRVSRGYIRMPIATTWQRGSNKARHKTAVCCHFTVSRSEGRGIDLVRAHARPRAAPTVGLRDVRVLVDVHQVPSLCKVSVVLYLPFRKVPYFWVNGYQREYLIISCCTDCPTMRKSGTVSTFPGFLIHEDVCAVLYLTCWTYFRGSKVGFSVY